MASIFGRLEGSGSMGPVAGYAAGVGAPAAVHPLRAGGPSVRDVDRAKEVGLTVHVALLF